MNFTCLAYPDELKISKAKFCQVLLNCFGGIFSILLGGVHGGEKNSGVISLILNHTQIHSSIYFTIYHKEPHTTLLHDLFLLHFNFAKFAMFSKTRKQRVAKNECCTILLTRKLSASLYIDLAKPKGEASLLFLFCFFCWHLLICENTLIKSLN